MIEAEPGQTVMNAAQAAGIAIPALCHDRSLAPEGSCRLCGVEVEGRRGEFTACTLPVAEGMVARSETPAVLQTRRQILELLLREYHDAGYASNDPETEFMYWVRRYRRAHAAGARAALRDQQRSQPLCLGRLEQMHPLQSLRARLRRGAGAVRLGHRRSRPRQPHRRRRGYDHARRALRVLRRLRRLLPHRRPGQQNVGRRGQARQIVTTTCGYCGVGCRFDLHVKDRRILRVVSNPHAAVNAMELCVKGRYGYDFVNHPDRLTKPRVRQYLLDGTPRPRDPRPLGRYRLEHSAEPGRGKAWCASSRSRAPTPSDCCHPPSAPTKKTIWRRSSRAR